MGLKLGCNYCKADPCCEPGYIEMPDNGPIAPCPICNNEDDYTRAERQRDLQNRPDAPQQGEGRHE